MIELNNATLDAWISLHNFLENKVRNKPILLCLDCDAIDVSLHRDNWLMDDTEINSFLSSYFVTIHDKAEHYPELLMLTLLYSQKTGVKIAGRSYLFLDSHFIPFLSLDMGRSIDNLDSKRAFIFDQIAEAKKIFYETDRKRERKAYHILGRAIIEMLSMGRQDKTVFFDIGGSLKSATNEALAFINSAESKEIPEGKNFKRPWFHLLKLYISCCAKIPEKQKAKALCEQQLRSLIMSPLYDILNGGCYIGSMGRDWKKPIVIKELYSNILLADLLLEYSNVFCNDEYLPVLEHTLCYLIKSFYSDDQKLFIDQIRYQDFIETFKDLNNVLSNEDLDYLEKYTNLNELRYNSNTHDYIHLEKQPIQREVFEKIVSLLRTVVKFKEGNSHLTKYYIYNVGKNARILSLFIKSSFLLKNPKYELTAKNLADTLWSLFERENNLPYCIKDERSHGRGILDSYSLLAEAFLNYYDWLLDNSYLEKAVKVHNYTKENFWDEKAGTFHVSMIIKKLTGKKFFKAPLFGIGGLATVLRNEVRLSLIFGHNCRAIVNSVYQFHYSNMLLKGPELENSSLLELFNWIQNPKINIVLYYLNNERQVLQEIQKIYKDFRAKSVIAFNIVNNKADEKKYSTILEQISSTKKKGNIYFAYLSGIAEECGETSQIYHKFIEFMKNAILTKPTKTRHVTSDYIKDNLPENIKKLMSTKNRS